MDDDKIYDQPSDVTAENGAVCLDGPNDLHMLMTPEAAEETSDRMTDQAVKARGQRRLGRFTHRAK
jgi:hypothetical protein